MTTRILVCGGRHYADKEAVHTQLQQAWAYYNQDILIIAGGATGADDIAAMWGWDNNVHVAVVRAQWHHHRRAAGHRRNAAMLALDPHLVLAFPGGTGTAGMCKIAAAAGVPVYKVG